MRKLTIALIVLLFPLVGICSDYDFKCKKHKGDKMKPPLRCENKEIVCYTFTGFSTYCFKKEYKIKG